MTTQRKSKAGEGASTSPSGPDTPTRQRDDSRKPSDMLEKEAERGSEKKNLTDKKGYNETPPNVPVKSVKK